MEVDFLKKVIRFGMFFLTVMLILQTMQPVTAQVSNMPDRAPLQALIAQALKHDGVEYTNSTWRAFDKALSAAQKVIADSTESQILINDSYNMLQSAMSSLMPIASFGNPFTDVRRNDWFYGAVMYVNANALMRGTTATSFEPLSKLTRATVVDALYHTESEPYVTFEALFNEDVTREQLAAILHRYAKYKGYDTTVPTTFTLNNFTDRGNVSTYAYEAIRWAVYLELMRGNDGHLNPSGTATRAEYATILQRLIDRFEFNRQPKQAQAQIGQHYIGWQFITYLTPDFMSAKQEFLPAQSVNVIERKNDGWARINTGLGDRWVYLNANMFYVERTASLYSRPNGSSDGMIEPQVVTVLQTQEGGWYQISTWLGVRWIYLRPALQAGDGPRIALTFDDGPSSHTKQLLDALYERGVVATFFVLGQQVASYPAVAVRIVEEGHEIASHSYKHPDLTKMSTAGIRSELTQSRDIIYKTTGVKPTILRPPYGSRNSTVQSVAGEFGYPLILWSVDTRDWESRNVNSIMTHFKSNNTIKIREGDIILLHDIYSTTIEAAIKAIDLLLAEGFVFVTVTDLLMDRFGEITSGKVYSSAR